MIEEMDFTGKWRTSRLSNVVEVEKKILIDNKIFWIGIELNPVTYEKRRLILLWNLSGICITWSTDEFDLEQRILSGEKL